VSPTPPEVVQRQLDCYNQRQLDAFCECFAEDATIFDLGAATPSYCGKAAIRERYRQLFDSSPALHCRLMNRVALGHVVVDHEHITGRMGSPDLFEIVAIYEVEGGLIRRVHFARP
jgi:hypothetical protein